jgi:hypothetical protein
MCRGVVVVVVGVVGGEWEGEGVRQERGGVVMLTMMTRGVG